MGLVCAKTPEKDSVAASVSVSQRWHACRPPLLMTRLTKNTIVMIVVGIMLLLDTAQALHLQPRADPTPKSPPHRWLLKWLVQLANETISD